MWMLGRLLALDRKLVRDLWRLRGQVLAVALVMASGIGVLIMSLSAVAALEDMRVAYYERYRFADVFAAVKRAPNGLAQRIAEIPGVQAVETRIRRLATLDVAGFAEPVMGLLASLPEGREPRLNRLALRAGRLVEPGRPDEVVLDEAFAEAHGLRPGDRLTAVINGRQRRLEIVGIALSPEFVYAIGPGQLMPDGKRFGVLWMGRKALEAAFDLEGAFDDVALALLPGAEKQEVIRRLDRLLDRYGGTGAYGREDQVSNWFLSNEIQQLETMAGILPTIFLVAAAFLTNMVVARLIATERSEIGLLKAFGYTDLEVAWHYLKLALVMSAVGVALGFALGYALGRWDAAIYARSYRFPFFYFRPSGHVFALAALIGIASALVATVGAVCRAAALPPAEAMRPPAPASFARSAAGRTRFDWLDQPSRMIVRQILRWPGRSLVSVVGIAMAVAVLTSALEWRDSVQALVESYFFQSQHQDATIVLNDARGDEAAYGFRAMPGVLAVEPGRHVLARFRHGRISKRQTVFGLPDAAVLSPLYDADGALVPVPPDGLVLSRKLAEVLGVSVGDTVTLEVLEGRRPTVALPVARVFETFIGTPAYMRLDALNRLMREPPVLDMVHVAMDPAASGRLFATLKGTPAIAAVMLRRAAVDNFNRTMGETMLIFIGFFTAFAGMLAAGVVYNGTRIALSERARELATLRVLGFTRMEISYILLGQSALLTLAGLPLGCLFGYGLARLMSSAFDSELYRVPLAIEPSTYGLAVLIVLAAATLSALIVRHRLDRLDLIAVLKTRE